MDTIERDLTTPQGLYAEQERIAEVMRSAPDMLALLRKIAEPFEGVSDDAMAKNESYTLEVGFHGESEMISLAIAALPPSEREAALQTIRDKYRQERVAKLQTHTAEIVDLAEMLRNAAKEGAVQIAECVRLRTLPTISHQPLDESDIECIEKQIIWPLQAIIQATGEYAHPDIYNAATDLWAALAKFQAVLRVGAEV